MLIHGLRAARLTVRLAWLAGTVALLTLTVLPALLPALGHQVYVVRGASMQPAIPLGSLVVVHPVDPAAVHVGEVVTFRLPQGTIVTHRVLAISDHGGLTFQTKGDASDTPDPTPVPASAIVGGVEYTVPGAGFLIYVLGSTLGGLLAVGILGALLLVGYSMDRLLRIIAPQAQRHAGQAGSVT